MARSKQSSNTTPGKNKLPSLPVVSYPQQLERRLIREDWQPNGFDRYVQQKAMDESMPIVTGYGYSPQRTDPVGQIEADFPVRKL